MLFASGGAPTFWTCAAAVPTPITRMAARELAAINPWCSEELPLIRERDPKIPCMALPPMPVLRRHEQRNVRRSDVETNDRAEDDESHSAVMAASLTTLAQRGWSRAISSA